MRDILTNIFVVLGSGVNDIRKSISRRNIVVTERDRGFATEVAERLKYKIKRQTNN